MRISLFRSRPADQLNIGFLLLLSAVVISFRTKIEDPSTLVLLYSALVAFQIFIVYLKGRNSLFRLTYDLIFPTLSILVIFDSLENIVHFINPRDIDPILIRLDYLIFNNHPTVMLESFISPLLTDLMQLAYSSYYFLPIILALVLKAKKNDSAFNHSLFLIMLCFYLSYIGYLLMPALGPRYTMNHLQSVELQGLIVGQPIQDFLNRLEGIKRDAFPSGHTGIALMVLYLSFIYEKKLFWIFTPLVTALIFSAVYGRYHYVVDIIAGIVLTLITLILGELYYGNRSKRINPDS